MSTVALLFGSNVFMTFAWYMHLKNMRSRPLWIVILVSWGIAFFEYCLQVPGNRLGADRWNIGQLKVMQEIISMVVFCVFAIVYMRRPFSWNLVGATLCLCGAAWFVFRPAAN